MLARAQGNKPLRVCPFFGAAKLSTWRIMLQACSYGTAALSLPLGKPVSSAYKPAALCERTFAEAATRRHC